MSEIVERLFSKGGGKGYQSFASAACGARGFSTGVAELETQEGWAQHWHNASEALTVVEGRAMVLIEDRVYKMSRLDCVHVPAGVSHAVRAVGPVTLHVSHGSASVATTVSVDSDHSRQAGNALGTAPETFLRFADSQPYTLSDGSEFYDLFAGRLGAVGICGGFARFAPGASLPCHIHEFDESITIIRGEAICLVQGKSYRLSDCDTEFVPQGRPHRFLNQSDMPMEMIWVYAGNEPSRTIVNTLNCSEGLWGVDELALKTGRSSEGFAR